MIGDREGKRTRSRASTAPPLEDYAMVGNGRNALLVSRDGSMDWWCAPRVDSDSWFAALLGDRSAGRWRIGPAEGVRRTRRAYRPGSLVLETVHEVDGGVLVVTDALARSGDDPAIVRTVECREGRATAAVDLAPVFEFGRLRPKIHGAEGGFRLVAGPVALRLWTDAPLAPDGEGLSGELTLSAGERAAFVLAHHASHAPAPARLDADRAIAEVDATWRAFSARLSYGGPWREAVLRSLLTVRALTWEPTGAIAAALTTSLPEKPGGVRNWDYRFAWLRDATLTFYALVNAGYDAEARGWRDFILRAAGGDARRMQTLYGVEGERHPTEWEVSWLPGYQGARPVRVGNGAYHQRQLDVPGEVVDCLHAAREEGLGGDPDGWELERDLAEEVARSWREPDDGIWEIRAGRRDFTSSKVMAWVALDRAIRDVEALGPTAGGDAERWRRTRAEIHADVCRRGWHSGRRAFTMAYGSAALDGSALLMPLVGFLPADDPRIVQTIEAIRRELMVDGLVLRYRTEKVRDGLPPGEGAFIPCTLWLADALTLLGRRDEARELFERVLSLRNDVGLLSEEYDTDARRLVGNFPQAFSHVALVNTATNLQGDGTAHRRAGHRHTPLGA